MENLPAQSKQNRSRSEPPQGLLQFPTIALENTGGLCYRFEPEICIRASIHQIIEKSDHPFRILVSHAAEVLQGAHLITQMRTGSAG